MSQQEADEYTRLTLVELLTATFTQEISLSTLSSPDQMGGGFAHDMGMILQLLARSPNEKVRFAVAGNKHLPAEALRTLALDEAWPVREATAENLHTPAEVLRDLALDDEAEVRSAVAWNPETSADVLQMLALDDEDEWVRETAAGNEHLPAEILRTLARDEAWRVRIAVASQVQVSVDLLHSLAQDKVAAVRQTVASHLQTPAEILQTLTQDHDERVRARVAAHPLTPVEILRTLARDLHKEVRTQIAAHPRTPVETLRVLAQDASAEVRRAVPMSEQTPMELLQTLAEDHDTTVRWMANLMQRLESECEELCQEQAWREGCRRLLPDERYHRWIGDLPVETQLVRVANLNVSDSLRQNVLAILAADWDTTKIRSAFAVRVDKDDAFYEAFRDRRAYYHHLGAAFMPPVALQKLALSAQWEIRYLVAFHPLTPQDTRQRLSQDGNRYVRAIAQACLHRINHQGRENDSIHVEDISV